MENLALVKPKAQTDGATPESIEIARDLVNGALEEGASAKMIAREAGISAGTLSQFRAGNYAGDMAAIATALLKWSETREAALSLELRRQNFEKFVLTATARKLSSAFAYSHRSGRMIEVVASPGLGKTRVALQYARRNSNVWIITGSVTTSVPNGVLDALCMALGLDVRVKDGVRRMQTAIEKRLRGTRGLVIVDEAQFFSFSSLETYRALADATGVGFVFLGSHALAIKIGGRRQIGTTAQFVSRLAMRVKIEAPHISDAPALLDEWEIADEDARRALLPLAARPGAFRNMVMMIELATLAASVAGEELGGKHFTSALKELEGD